MQEIKAYIEEELQNPAAAVNVLAKIMQTVRLLTEQPRMGAPFGVCSVLLHRASTTLGPSSVCSVHVPEPVALSG